MDTTPHPLPTHVEVAVVGAGFAGLQAALVLGRAQREVVVLGLGPTRNAETERTHNLLTREGATPDELLDAGRAEVEALRTVAVHELRVEEVLAPDDVDAPLRLRLADGRELGAGHVVLATGARDALPPVPGLVELWGRRAHSCPFCDAAPYAGRRVLLLAPPDAAAHQRTLLSGWTGDVVELAPQDAVLVEERDGVVIAHTTDGGELRADGVFVRTTPLPRLDPVAGLELAHRGPYLAVDAQQRTTLPRLLAVGDCAWRDGDAMPGGQVVAALAAGSVAAATVILDHVGMELPPTPPAEPPRRTGRAEHRHGHGDEVDPATPPAEFWERRYGEGEQVWTGRPNRALVDALDGVPPGTALDLGCGEGGDAVWLAEQGWRVTAVDVAATALRRGEQAAARRGVAGRTTWLRADLADGLPDGAWDLVVAAYLHSPVALPRERVLRAARDRVAPGGLLVVVAHLAAPPGMPPDDERPFPDLGGQLDALELDERWEVRTAAPVRPRVLGPDGVVTHRRDGVLVLRRSG